MPDRALTGLVGLAIPGVGWLRLALKFAPWLALALFVGWAARVNHLRGNHLQSLHEVADTLGEALSAKIGVSQLVPAANRLAGQRDQYLRERENARAVIQRQADSINALHDESERLAKLSEKDRALAKEMIRQRDVWIATAKAASTRTERLSAEQELEQCDAVLNALFDAGF